MSTDRIEDLTRRVQESDVDLVVLNPSPSFTLIAGHEFTSHERLFLLFVPGDGAPAAVVPLLERGNWAQAVPSVDAVYPWDDKDGSDDAAEAACARFFSAKRVAIEPLAMRYMEYSVLRRFLPDAEFVSADPIVGPLRLKKSAEDAQKLRRAAEIAEEALRVSLSELRIGMTERELTGRLSSLLLSGGGEGISFGPIVLSGPKSALPHGEPDDRPIGEGNTCSSTSVRATAATTATSHARSRWVSPASACARSMRRCAPATRQGAQPLVQARPTMRSTGRLKNRSWAKSSPSFRPIEPDMASASTSTSLLP